MTYCTRGSRGSRVHTKEEVPGVGEVIWRIRMDVAYLQVMKLQDALVPCSPSSHAFTAALYMPRIALQPYDLPIDLAVHPALPHDLE